MACSSLEWTLIEVIEIQRSEVVRNLAIKMNTAIETLRNKKVKFCVFPGQDVNRVYQLMTSKNRVRSWRKTVRKILVFPNKPKDFYRTNWLRTPSRLLNCCEHKESLGSSSMEGNKLMSTFIWWSRANICKLHYSTSPINVASSLMMSTVPTNQDA